MIRRLSDFVSAPSVVVAMGIFVGGCTPAIKPSKLFVPKEITCIDIPQELDAHEVRGLLKVHWTTRVLPGPYVAEREDGNGTYYRAPPGGIQIIADGTENKSANMFTHMAYDGGIWVPSNSSLPPHIYTYFSTGSAAVVPVPEGASCANAKFAQDPETKGVSLAGFAMGGAAAGAVGGAAARATVSHGSMSYGQAAGAGAAGGLLGGVIVAAIINNDVGKIVKQPLSKDANFVIALQNAVKAKITVHPAEANSELSNRGVKGDVAN